MMIIPDEKARATTTTTREIANLSTKLNFFARKLTFNE
jgi:hypothetical protein